MNKTKKVLIVDDEEDILDLLSYNLEKEGFTVRVAEDGIVALKVAKEFRPDLVLLDIMMPNQDGIETCRQLREVEELSDTYIIFLTARVEEYSEIAAFDSGADDYLTKPIKPRALMSRVQAVFRRSTKIEKGSAKIEIANLIIDKGSYTVLIGEKELSLPKKEFEVLYQLALKPNKIHSREELLSKIWGDDIYVVARTVDVHIRKVREKIGEHFISTVKGVGYKFEAN